MGLRGRCPAGENVPLQPVDREGRCKIDGGKAQSAAAKSAGAAQEE